MASQKKGRSELMRMGTYKKRDKNLYHDLYTGLVHRPLSPRRTEKEEQQNHITSYKQCQWTTEEVCEGAFTVNKMLVL